MSLVDFVAFDGGANSAGTFGNKHLRHNYAVRNVGGDINIKATVGGRIVEGKSECLALSWS